MMMDRIADMLTRIRNAQMAGIEKVEMPASKTLLSLAELLQEEGYLATVKVYNHKGHRYLRVGLRYDEDGVNSLCTSCLKIGIDTGDGQQQLESSSSTQTTLWQHIAITWTSGANLQLMETKIFTAQV